MPAAALVRALYESYQERAWERAAAYLHPEATVTMPATAERLDGRADVISFQRDYPEPWGTITVVEVVGDGRGERAAGRIRVVDPSGQTFEMAAFWTTRDGLLADGVEYWVTVGGEEPPAGRRSARPPA